MVTRRKDLAPVKPNVNCFGYGNKKLFLTIHQTGNTSKGANADMHARLQKNNTREASWHWQVDDKEAVQSFEHSVSCYHASDGSGEGNMNSIAVEGCINSDGNYKKSVQNMAELAAWILKTENIPLTNMKQHYDWARDKKNCPAQIRGGKDGIDWTKFVQMVQTELNKLNGKPTVSGAKSYKLVTTVNGYINAADARNKKNAKTKVAAGNYTVFSEANGMINVTSKAGIPGSWINPSENKAPVAVSKPSLKSLDAIAKEVLDGKWGNDPERTKKLTSAGYDAKAVQAKVNELSKPVAKKTYVQLAAHEPLWRAYRLGTSPVEGNEVGFLAPRQYGGLEYQILGYENNGTCAIIQTEAFGRVKIFIKDPSAKIVTR